MSEPLCVLTTLQSIHLELAIVGQHLYGGPQVQIKKNKKIKRKNIVF